MNRREYLTALGAAASASLAGCGGDGGDSAATSARSPTDPPTDSPTPTSRATETDTTAPPSGENLVDVDRDGAATHTFGSVLQMRDFGWTDRELHYGTPGATGVIENVGEERLLQASLSVDFYDEDTQLGTNTSWFEFLEHGEYGALDVPYTGSEPGRITRLVVSASVQTEPITPLNDGQVTVSDSGLSENDNGWPAVAGTVVNDTDERLERVTLHVNFYRDQELLGYGRDAVPRLGTEGRAEWSTTTDRPDVEEVNRYVVVATVRQ